jgi:Cu(I)/Ag(I) efflux system membrane protein CusA/SilA
MIDRLIALSIRHRWLTIAAGVALAVWGVIAVYQTPVDAVPDLSENQVIVFTDWPGHSPREIEDQVTYPLSLQLQGLAGVRTVRGSSDVGFSMLHLIFDDAVGFDTARSRVRERLTQSSIDLPDGVVPRLAPDAIPTGQIFWYTVEGRGYDLARLRDIQDWYVRPQLQSVAGVAEVATVGGQVLEYHVQLDPARLQSFDVSLRDVVDQLARSNFAVGGGVLQQPTGEVIVRGVGWLGAVSPLAPDDVVAGSPDPATSPTEGLPSTGRPSVAKTAGSGVPRRTQDGNHSTHDSPSDHSSISENRTRVLRDLDQLLIRTSSGNSVKLTDIATVTLGTRPRRGVFEKDGNEVTGGVVLMRFGENPLEVTRRIKTKLRELQPGLPAGVHVVSCYDRTPLIEGAVATVTGTLVEAIVTATVCVVLILLHLRTSFVIAITLPLAALMSFVIMWTLRRLGVADIQTNIMSLAGIAISIGVLVDSSIVIAENVLHRLREEFGDRPVTGDIRAIVLSACQTVGRPIFFSVLIMLVSFLPVFALGGIDGRMFRPLAFTKSFALVSVALLAVTLVPALCTIFIRGRVRSEMESWVVRSVHDVYRPVLEYLIDRPGPLVWVIAVTFVLGTVPLGRRDVVLSVLACGIIATGSGVLFRGGHRAASDDGVTRSAATKKDSRPLFFAPALAVASLVLIALVAEATMTPLQTENRLPLDEGMVMDMPITVPRISATQAGDDLKARNMVLCRFPEVRMVVGKAGRAETPFDPAPLDMIETMVDFRPAEFWPKRKLARAAATRHARLALAALCDSGLIELPADSAATAELFDDSLVAALTRFDAVSREYAFHRNRECETTVSRDLSGDLVTQTPKQIERRQQELWREHVRQLNSELLDRSPRTFTQLVVEEVLKRATISDPKVIEIQSQIAAARTLLPPGGGDGPGVRGKRLSTSPADPSVTQNRVSKPDEHHGPANYGPLPIIDPHPVLDKLVASLTGRLTKSVVLFPCDREELTGFGGELDQALQMPGWTNVWTKPIQNRVDMLATGVNTAIGVRVLGNELDVVVRVSEEIAAVLREVPGAADVIADPIRGKGYLEIHPNRAQAEQFGVSLADLHDLIEIALGGRIVTTTIEGRQRHSVRVRYPRDAVDDVEAIRKLVVKSSPHAPRAEAGTRSVPATLTLGDVADVRLVEGPATIKSENGWLRNYVRLNVRGRGEIEFVDAARRIVAERVNLPAGVVVEWTGQFEHTQQTARTLAWVMPVMFVLILLLLYLTYHDIVDACLMLVAVPGALAGGVLFQWLFGYRFSVAVGVGYIACFGMAVATGMIMLVYLREAVDRAGGEARLTVASLRQAVIAGAVQRLRPKLLTEGTTILGLAPMLWATGVGAEVIRPMAAPVLGGILIADEVIDLLLPVLFFWVRRWRIERRDQTLVRPDLDAVNDQPAFSISPPTSSTKILEGVEV